jgi:hypothetical protein
MPGLREGAVRQVFISYARDDRRRVEALAERLRRLVDAVWFDSQLHGGEDWWAAILDRIRNSDIFLAVISPASLGSEACRIERQYATAVHRTIIPVALTAVPSALPTDVATLQIVDFTQPGEQALTDLARALLASPDPKPLPDPLPADPEAPLSYLTDLVDLVNSPRELTKSEQMEIVCRLERGLESPDQDEREGARQVLQRMKSRDDLAASVEKTIDLLAGEHIPSTAPAPLRQPDPSPDPALIYHVPTARWPQPSSPRPVEAPSDRSSHRAVAPPPPVRTEAPKPRRRHPIRAMGALVVLALLAGAAWMAITSMGGDDGGDGDPPVPGSPYERLCTIKNVTTFPGDVTVDKVDPETMKTWACFLYEKDVIGDYESNFTGNYTGNFPSTVKRWKEANGFPDPTANLDEELFDCLQDDSQCPSSGDDVDDAVTPGADGPPSDPVTPSADAEAQ